MGQILSCELQNTKIQQLKQLSYSKQKSNQCDYQFVIFKIDKNDMIAAS